MSATDWPREVGEHTVNDQWECEECGESYDCFSQFRQNPCE